MAPKATAASAKAVQEQLAARGERFNSWSDDKNVWEVGDTCGVEGEAGVFKIVGFKMEALDRCVASLVGGPVWGQEQTREWRSFDPKRLSTKILKQGKRKSIEEESDE
jgi:hypothetical protein